MSRKVCRYLFTYLAIIAIVGFSTTTGSAQNRRTSGGTFSVAAAPGHRLSTDKNAYKFNEQAKISGKNFTPLAMTRLTVETVGGFGLNEVVVTMWDVYADASGKFTTTWMVAYPGSAFRVSAKDMTASVETSTEFIMLGGGASLEQCRNGTLDSPVPCTGAAWANGNLNASQAHYVEGGSIPYRLIFAGLDIGTQYTVTIEWDTTVSQSTHALDYLTSYNRTETTADPCTGIGVCNPAVFTTAPIPVDPNVTAGEDTIPGTMDDVVQVTGAFTYFGGTIDAVSGYTTTGSFAGASTNRITVTFTPSVADTVLAWGGHISTRSDWGTANSAAAINGSPFHMRLHDFNGSPGGQDRAIHSDAVIFPAKVNVVVDVRPQSFFPFTFAMSGLDITTMSLDDNGVESDTYQSTHTFSDILLFGATNQVKVTEDPPPSTYSLVELTCVSDPTPGLGSGVITTSLMNRQAVIELAEGETVTCTFVNASPTSARVSVAGLVNDSLGRGLPNVLVTAVNTATGEMTTARTNMFGFYRLTNLEAGSDYVIYPRSLRYNFELGATMLNVTRNESGVNFTATANP